MPQNHRQTARTTARSTITASLSPVHLVNSPAQWRREERVSIKMAKNTFLDWDTIANNNTDVGGINIAENCPPSNINNGMRETMAQLRAGVDGEVVYAAKAGNYTALAADNNAVHRYTATATVTLTAAATLGTNWHYTVIADGADVTIDPNGAETIDGSATLIVPNGASVFIICNGSAFFTDKALTTFNKAPAGHLYGLTLSNNGSDAANDIDIAVGSAASDAASSVMMTLASALTKRLDAGWAVGTNQGGLDTGAVGNNIYYVWEIQRSDTGVVDALFSLSSTAPTMPANYDRKRVIGSFARVSATNQAPRSYSQKEATPWVAYTPVFNGVGTATSIACRSRRVGSCLEVEAIWTNGTTTATIFDISLGFNGVNANVVCDTFWNARRPLVGNVVYNLDGPITMYALGLGGAGVVNIGFASSLRNGFTPVSGATIGTGTILGIRVSVPIEGWN
jgi:hypothetical protein